MAYFRTLAARFNALQSRERILIVAVTLAILYALSDLLWFSPQQAEARRTEGKQPDPGTRLWQQLFGQLIGAPIAGALIGWGLDYVAAQFGHRTFPLFFVLMLFFGFGVGVRNIMRLTRTGTPPGI